MFQRLARQRTLPLRPVHAQEPEPRMPISADGSSTDPPAASSVHAQEPEPIPSVAAAAAFKSDIASGLMSVASWHDAGEETEARTAPWDSSVSLPSAHSPEPAPDATQAPVAAAASPSDPPAASCALDAAPAPVKCYDGLDYLGVAKDGLDYLRRSRGSGSDSGLRSERFERRMTGLLPSRGA